MTLGYLRLRINVTFFANHIANNPVGMQVGTAWPIMLYHNNFVNNSQQIQALDDGFYFWSMDNGKEGNYWSDYYGKDANGDGIGESQY